MEENIAPLISHIGIPYRWTEFDAKVYGAIADALNPNQEDIWTNFLYNYPVTEGIADLETSAVARALLKVKVPIRERYPLDAELRDMNALHEQRDDPALDTDPVSDLLVASDSFLKSILRPNILSLVNSGAPPRGHLMYFTSRLHRCLVVEYEVLNHDTLYLGFESTIPSPTSVFDVFDNIDKVTPRGRNTLKAMLASGHKIVGHRNTLVHVDRRNDSGVFGPAIDTLYLNEMLFKYLYEPERLQQSNVDYSLFRTDPTSYPGFDVAKAHMFKNMLEIGSGSGLLIASFIRNVAWFDRFVAIDPSIDAIRCTYRTSAGLRTDKTRRIGEVKGTYMCGRFDPDFLNTKFDMVICNPPYIPLPPSHESYRGPFMEAVGGTDLLEQVLATSPRLLSPQGFLFMVCSSLADEEFVKRVPSEIAVEPLGLSDGMRVPFDVESVLNNKHWLDWLIEERNLIHLSDMYYHKIKCYALHLREEAGFEDTWGLLARIRSMNQALVQVHESSAPIPAIPLTLESTSAASLPPSIGTAHDTIMLRFRNLSGGGIDTIAEHQAIVEEHGYTWWGWWKRQTEITPRDLFSELSRRTKQAKTKEGRPVIYLFDNGKGRLYSARLLQVQSQANRDIACPEPNAVPAYYRGQEHAAWFKLQDITEVSMQSLPSFVYRGFPTLATGAVSQVGRNIEGWEELSQALVTLWWIDVP